MDIAIESLYPTPLQNSTLLPLLLLSLATQRHAPEPSTSYASEYDFIIVGSGASGSVVANRLSELSCASVLLLEAGKKPPLLTEVPGLARYFHGTDLDWSYKSAAQTEAGLGRINQQFPLSAGKMIGGSTTFNSMSYVRGNKKDYDLWESLGATGWSYDDVHPYFLKLEDNKDPDVLSNGFHASGGPVSVERPKYDPAIKGAIRDAAISLGYEVLDSNGAKQTGFYDHQAFLRNQQRCGAAKAYLVPAENRTNLDILSNAYVTKIMTNGNEATGVQFDFQNQTIIVNARKEVILTGGAIQTPQLLKLSGIGPADELEKMGIPVVADLPVGKNFQNHAGIRYPFIVPPEPDFDTKVSDPDNINQYMDSRTGPLCANGHIFTAFLNDLEIKPVEDFPNYQLYFYETPITYYHKTGLKPEVFNAVYGPYLNQSLYACAIQLNRPESKGSVTLLSSNPYDHPVIDPQYLADPKDIDVLVQGLKNCKRLLDTDAFHKFGAKPIETVIPGCEGFVGDDDAYFRCQVKTMLFTRHHPSGTCKMGDPSDSETVVDSELKVKNMKKLRVVDTSVMPTVTTGNTNAPAIMIAEKASDAIKKTMVCPDAKDKEPPAKDDTQKGSQRTSFHFFDDNMFKTDFKTDDLFNFKATNLRQGQFFI